MITFKELEEQLDEAHKVGDKVLIHKGPADVKGKEGHVSEIRKGLYKGAPKTYTVDYDHHETTGARKSIQLKPTHFKAVKEDLDEAVGHTIEAHGIKGTKGTPWRKTFKSHEHLHAWADKNDSVTIHATRELEGAKKKTNEETDASNKREKAMADFDKESRAAYWKKHVELKKKDPRVSKPVKEEALDEVKMTAAMKLQQAFQREQEKTARERKAGEDLLKKNEPKKTNEEVDLEEGTFKYHMDKAIAAHDRGDINKKKLHLNNAKQARYALKSTEITKHKDLLDKYKSMTEEVMSEGAYEKAEENKKSADAAKKQGDMFAHHMHMADHHDNLAQWHGEKGRHGEADRHAQKSDEHHDEAMKLKEEVKEGLKPQHNMRPGWMLKADPELAAKVKKNKDIAKARRDSYGNPAAGKSVKEDAACNNVGGGAIAGTQGDAGKKSVTTKMLKRKELKNFKEFTESCDCWTGYKRVPGTKPCDKGSCKKV